MEEPKIGRNERKMGRKKRNKKMIEKNVRRACGDVGVWGRYGRRERKWVG